MQDSSHEREETERTRRWIHSDGEAARRTNARLLGIAERLMARERGDHTWGPGDLVDEAWPRLVSAAREGWHDSGHFYGQAAQAMRARLIDHERRRRTAKRGGDWNRVPLHAGVALHEPFDETIVALRDALDRLASGAPRAAAIVRMRYYERRAPAEIARHLGISVRTVARCIRTAGWLIRRMLDEPGLG